MSENTSKNNSDVEANYIPLGITRFSFEVDLPDGSIVKTEKIFPHQREMYILDELGRFLNNFMPQLGSPAHTRELIPMISVDEDELEPLLEFLSNLREEKGEDPSTGIDIIGGDDDGSI